MKNHKFWAWALVFCLFMKTYTGSKHKYAENKSGGVSVMVNYIRKINKAKTGIFAAGVLFGTAGIKILSSKDAKKFYTNCTAAVLRAKE